MKFENFRAGLTIAWDLIENETESNTVIKHDSAVLLDDPIIKNGRFYFHLIDDNKEITISPVSYTDSLRFTKIMLEKKIVNSVLYLGKLKNLYDGWYNNDYKFFKFNYKYKDSFEEFK